MLRSAGYAIHLPAGRAQHPSSPVLYSVSHPILLLLMLLQIGILPVIVHGGGPQIKAMLEKLEIESNFLQGLRVTDKATMEVAQMILCGSINKDIAGMISNQPGVKGAIGLCGLDGKLIQAKKMEKTGIDEATGKTVPLDFGLVGDPTIVNTQLLKELLSCSLVPVIAPVGSNEVGGGSLNINADTAAGNVAEALKVRTSAAVPHSHLKSLVCTSSHPFVVPLPLCVCALST